MPLLSTTAQILQGHSDSPSHVSFAQAPSPPGQDNSPGSNPHQQFYFHITASLNHFPTWGGTTIGAPSEHLSADEGGRGMPVAEAPVYGANWALRPFMPQFAQL